MSNLGGNFCCARRIVGRELFDKKVNPQRKSWLRLSNYMPIRILRKATNAPYKFQQIEFGNMTCRAAKNKD